MYSCACVAVYESGCMLKFDRFKQCGCLEAQPIGLLSRKISSKSTTHTSNSTAHLNVLPAHCSAELYAKMTSLLRTYFTPVVTGLPSCSRQSSPCLCSSARPASGHTLATTFPFLPAQQRHCCSCCDMPSLAVCAQRISLSRSPLAGV